MTKTNLNGTPDAFDGEAKEEQPHQNLTTTHVNGALAAKTGGQMNGGVVVQSGNREQSENENGPETV